MPQLILASASPRRLQLLGDLGIHPRVIPPRAEEITLPGEAPEQIVLRLAREEAQEVASRCPDSAWVLAADTLVAVEEAVLGKPQDDEAARAMLLRLRGRSHEVWTGVCLITPQQTFSEAERTEVRFRDFPDALLDWYVDCGEPRDKAGAYGIQGFGVLLADGLQGSWTNVVGLPLERLAIIFERAGRSLQEWSRPNQDQTST